MQYYTNIYVLCILGGTIVKMYRKILAIVSVLIVSLSFSSCKNNDNSNAKDKVSNKEQIEELDIASYETGVDYDMLMSSSDEYIGQKVKISGKVEQVLQNGNKTTVRIAVNNDSNKIILGVYKTNLSNIMIFEGDIVTIRGVYDGIVDYNTVFGKTVSIPGISVDKIELN